MKKITRAWAYYKQKGFKKTLLHLFHCIKSYFKKRRDRWLAKKQKNKRRSLKLSYKPLVSIILLIQNGSLAEETVSSIRKQFYKNYELFVWGAKVSRPVAANEHWEVSASKDILSDFKQALNHVKGEYVILLTEDDILKENALYEFVANLDDGRIDVLYSDEEQVISKRQRQLYFKPDWSPDLLYSGPFYGWTYIYRRSLAQVADLPCSGSRSLLSFCLLLEASVRGTISHVPEVLWTVKCPSHDLSVIPEEDRNVYLDVLEKHVKNTFNKNLSAGQSRYNTSFCLNFEQLGREPLVSIIIPTKDHVDLLAQCVDSILDKTKYSNYEILILDNRSEEEMTRKWLCEIESKHPQVRSVKADFEFNWSKLNNFGMAQSNGEVFVFLNNDTLIIEEDWLSLLAGNAIKRGNGVVGGLLLYEDGTIQHAGVVIGMNDWADHVFKGELPSAKPTCFVPNGVSRNVLAVTGACMAISKETIDRIGPFHEGFIICGSDVEICIRAYKAGLWNVYVPDCRLYHLESKSRDQYIPEIDFIMSDKYYAPYRLGQDPFYNQNLSKAQNTPKEI